MEFDIVLHVSGEQAVCNELLETLRRPGPYGIGDVPDEKLGVEWDDTRHICNSLLKVKDAKIVADLDKKQTDAYFKKIENDFIKGLHSQKPFGPFRQPIYLNVDDPDYAIEKENLRSEYYIWAQTSAPSEWERKASTK